MHKDREEVNIIVIRQHISIDFQNSPSAEIFFKAQGQGFSRKNLALLIFCVLLLKLFLNNTFKISRDYIENDGTYGQ